MNFSLTLRQKQIAVMVFGMWLISSVAFSNGSLAPELPLLNRAKDGPEYTVIRRLQELTTDLHLLELTIKNRRDEETELKIATAVQEIQNSGDELITRFRHTREKQLEGIKAFFAAGRKFSVATGIDPEDWDAMYDEIASGRLNEGPVTLPSHQGPLAVLHLSPLSMGNRVVWHASLPAFDRSSFWGVARAAALRLELKNTSALKTSELEKRLNDINNPYPEMESLAKKYFDESHRKLYATFEGQRYAMMQRVTLARKAVEELARMPTAMGTPEEFAALYNQTIENLFSYGVTIGLSGTIGQSGERTFLIKGFLFSDSPEAAKEMLQKLKVNVQQNAGSYSAPSS